MCQGTFSLFHVIELFCACFELWWIWSFMTTLFIIQLQECRQENCLHVAVALKVVGIECHNAIQIIDKVFHKFIPPSFCLQPYHSRK